MCRFASFVLTREREYWCSSDKHEDIIAEHALGEMDGEKCGIVRVEITPSATPSDLSTWKYRVEQDVMPEWTFGGDPELESRARGALSRRAQEESWFVEVTGPNATTGAYGTATTGAYGTAPAGFKGKATAGEGGTATAGNYGTATAGDGGKATAGRGGKATAG